MLCSTTEISLAALQVAIQNNKSMAAYLMCITISGGVPIFNRKFGDIKTVRFVKKKFT